MFDPARDELRSLTKRNDRVRVPSALVTIARCAFEGDGHGSEGNDATGSFAQNTKAPAQSWRGTDRRGRRSIACRAFRGMIATPYSLSLARLRWGSHNGVRHPASRVLIGILPRFAAPTLRHPWLRVDFAYDARSPLGRCGAVCVRSSLRLPVARSLRSVADRPARSSLPVGHRRTASCRRADSCGDHPWVAVPAAANHSHLATLVRPSLALAKNKTRYRVVL